MERGGGKIKGEQIRMSLSPLHARPYAAILESMLIRRKEKTSAQRGSQVVKPAYLGVCKHTHPRSFSIRAGSDRAWNSKTRLPPLSR